MNARVSVFQGLSAHLKRQRNEILQRWRASVLADPSLTTGSALPTAQLYDHVPDALIAFERHLAQGSADEGGRKTEETIEAAVAHGKHRWQQGYDLREVVRELGHLNQVLVAELDAFALESSAPAEAMSAARSDWAASYAAGIEQSTHQFYQLRQIEAAGHVLDLENALQEITEFDRQRATLWEQLAHDLRGNVGVVAAATRALQLKSAPDDPRERFTRMLDRNVESLRHLLDDVTSLTRLQAGTEQRQLGELDVTALLDPMCDGLQSLALQRGLYLRSHRPDQPLLVQGDAVKVRRLAQNLIINALKYTLTGGVDVHWAACDQGDGKRWVLTVADTGPGIHAGPGAPLANALQEATELAHENDSSASDGGETIAVHPADLRPVRQASGEGIGLSIVKRLAELLDATVELESDPESGTVFKILLPKRYDAAAT